MSEMTGARPMTDHPAPVSGRDAVRAAGDGLSALGAVLVLLGLWRALLVLEVLPATAASWWPAVLVLVSVWLATRRRRGAAITLAALGTGLLVVTNVPGEFFGPALLITVGALVVLGTISGRRVMTDFPGVAGVALFSDREVQVAPGDPAQPLIAVFGAAESTLVGPGPQGDVVTCAAVFGSAKLTVPRDVVVAVSPLAVFGDVKTPPPPTGTPAGTLRVRAMAVFGDVEVRRA